MIEIKIIKLINYVHYPRKPAGNFILDFLYLLKNEIYILKVQIEIKNSLEKINNIL